jgi:hypothetical protein
MRALMSRWPVATFIATLLLGIFAMPLLYNGLPGGFWILLPLFYFLPAAFRGLWNDANHIKRWVHARTVRAKVSDEALHAFLNERSDERQ